MSLDHQRLVGANGQELGEDSIEELHPGGSVKESRQVSSSRVRCGTVRCGYPSVCNGLCGFPAPQGQEHVHHMVEPWVAWKAAQLDQLVDRRASEAFRWRGGSRR